MSDNTSCFICNLNEEIQKEIYLTLQNRLLNKDLKVDNFDIIDMMTYRLCDIYDNKNILYNEVLSWSNNKSIIN